jgi:hypothetical protein
MNQTDRQYCGTVSSTVPAPPSTTLDVNGTVRDVFAGASAAYHGVDIRPGAGVDEVLDVTRLAERFEPGGSVARA